MGCGSLCRIGVYGLERNGWYDERLDPEKATHAYAREMKKAYDQLGDWYLAMAAYDWGAGNVQRAVQRTGYADFWELYRRNNLPTETKNYVPIILAVTILAKNPKQYGLDDLTPDPPLLSTRSGPTTASICIWSPTSRSSGAGDRRPQPEPVAWRNSP